MESEHTQVKTFSRRAILVTGLQGVVFLGLGARLFNLQVIEGSKYKMLAENNRIDVQWLPPRRGKITDRNGEVLAENKHDFRVFVLPEQISSMDEAIEMLRGVVSVTDQEKADTIKRAKNQNRFMPVMVRDNLGWDELSAIELRLPELEGAQVRIGLTRSYPRGSNSAHVVGYVGAPTDDDVADNPLYKIPDVRIGKSGIERKENDALLGTPGSSRREVDVRGRIVRELESDVGVAGQDIALTLDAEMQQIIADSLAKYGKSGAAILMDAYNGEVYGLVSYPAYDPGKFSQGISHDDWEIYRDDVAKPMNNKALSGVYPPGSTFKMITALAALEAGVITKDTSFFCPGHYDVGNQTFHCWKPAGHGTVDVVRALSESCDVFFYNVARDVGIDRIAAMARRFGLGNLTGTEFKEEANGVVPDRNWKRRRYNAPWFPGETINASIGQGYTLVTPIQLTVMMARLVNGGALVKPQLIKARNGKAQTGGNISKQPIRPDHLELILAGMSNCVNDPHGTAYAARIWDTNYSFGGKSGTAQVKRITKLERALGIRNDSLAWNLRHHALFVAYGPVIDPRYVCCVVIEHGGGGSAAAAPVARDIMIEAQKRNLGAAKDENAPIDDTDAQDPA